jgi:putative PEP-CTERM system TPR-repeat lipoprotein
VLLAVALLGGCQVEPDTPGRLLAKAQQAREKGDYKVAVIHLLNAANATPDDPRVRYLLGLSYKDDGNFAAALIEFRKALELHYDPAKVLPELGKSLLAMKRYDQLLEEVRVGTVTDNHAVAEILTLRALGAMGLYRPAEGRDLLASALQVEPELADALVGQALLDVADGKIDAASGRVDRAIASAPRNVDAWLLRGDLDRLLKRDSAGAYRKVLELDPKNVLARVNLVSMDVAAEKYRDARVLLDELHKLAPDNPIASYMEGVIEFRRSNNAAAREWAARALKVAPRHIPSLLLFGATEVALGHYSAAPPYLAYVVDRLPENLYARKLLVISLKETGQTLKAREVLRSGFFHNPADIDLLVLAGEVALQANDLPAARGFFEKAVKADPKSASARTGLGASRLAVGETDRALDDLEAAAALDSRIYQADVLLVMTNLQRGRYDQALKAIASLEKKQPTNPLTYNLKGSIYLAKADIPSARKYFQQALELQPTYLPAAQNLAQIYVAAGNPKLGRKLLEDILGTNDGNVETLLALAELAPRIGATSKEQIDWLQRARAASPGMARPALMLARAYSQAGQVDKAIEVVSEAQALDRDNVELLNALGEAQIAGGEKSKAVATYTRLASLQAKSAVAFYRLANAQALNSDTAGAASSLRKALELQPDYVDALSALVGLEIRGKRFDRSESHRAPPAKAEPQIGAGVCARGRRAHGREERSRRGKTLRNGVQRRRERRPCDQDLRCVRRGRKAGRGGQAHGAVACRHSRRRHRAAVRRGFRVAGREVRERDRAVRVASSEAACECVRVEQSCLGLRADQGPTRAGGGRACLQAQAGRCGNRRYVGMDADRAGRCGAWRRDPGKSGVGDASKPHREVPLGARVVQGGQYREGPH